jgi:hypothetical protein
VSGSATIMAHVTPSSALELRAEESTIYHNLPGRLW